MNSTLQHTALHDWNLRHGARMGPFAGYDMPIRYAPGTIAEHQHTRTQASLFDVSHMGIAELSVPGQPFHAVADIIERLVPCDVDLLAPGRQRYTQLLNETGGIVDDLMVARTVDDPDALTIVSNAARHAIVFGLIDVLIETLDTPGGSPAVLRRRTDLALIALQGPASQTALERLAENPATVSSMAFMDVRNVLLQIGADHAGGTAVLAVPATVSRSGYTGEDGFEIAIDQRFAEALADALVSFPEVEPAGLGARDTLRLEAGLCLYGADIDDTTSPIEAGLAWSIQRRRREMFGFVGEDRVRHELASGTARRLVGLVGQGRALVRDHARLFADAVSTEPIGVVTSGGFSPTLGRPVSMGYVSVNLARPGTTLLAEVRGARHAVDVVNLPFVQHTYRRTDRNTTPAQENP